MQIRLTVLAPPSGQTPARTCDVLVTAPAGTALATVASNLAAAVTGPDGSLGSGAVVLFAGRERLDAQRCALGEPPLVDGAVLSLQVPGEDEAADDAVPAQLHVVAGPDAGGVHLLHGGQIRIGRSADADVPLDDPDVSRLHCAVTVSEDGRVSVADLGSTNGTSLDGTEVHDQPVRLKPGALLRLGESTLRLASGARTPTLATAPDGEGHLRVARASDGAGEDGNLPEGSASEISRPGSGGYGSGHSYGAGVSPGFGSGEGVAHAYGSGAPAEAGDRGGQGPAGRATDDEAPRRGGIGAWARRLAGNKAEPVHEAAPDETLPAGRPVPSASSSVAASRPSSSSSVGETWPDPATVLLTALGPGPRLWERDAEHPEALVVRLGTTDRAELPAVPVTVGLREAGSLGLAGPRERLAGLTRSVVAQLAALHSPADLEIVLISTDRARNADERRRQWAWLGWLPHLRPMHGQDCRLLLAYDREQATARTTELVRRLDDGPLGTGWASVDRGTVAEAARRYVGAHTVVIVDGDPGSAVLRETTARLAAAGAAAGIHLICLAETPAASPTSPVPATYEAACHASIAFRECGAVAMLSGDVATALRLLRTAGGQAAGHGTVAAVDAVSAAWAERFGRALAPLRTDGSATAPGRRTAAALPSSARLLDELGLARATPASLMARWASTSNDQPGATVHGLGSMQMPAADTRGSGRTEYPDSTGPRVGAQRTADGRPGAPSPSSRPAGAGATGARGADDVYGSGSGRTPYPGGESSESGRTPYPGTSNDTHAGTPRHASVRGDGSLPGTGSGRTLYPGLDTPGSGRTPYPGADTAGSGRTPYPRSEASDSGRTPYPGTDNHDSGRTPYPGLDTPGSGRTPYPGADIHSSGRTPYPGSDTPGSGRTPYPRADSSASGRTPYPAGDTSGSGRTPYPGADASDSGRTPYPATPRIGAQRHDRAVGDSSSSRTGPGAESAERATSRVSGPRGGDAPQVAARVTEGASSVRAAAARTAPAPDATAVAVTARPVVVLGAGPRGALSVDLADEGPHLLIEGPAGSGRTELLRAVAASLAAAARPDRLGLLLVDGAGGERGDSLQPCTELPHTFMNLTASDPLRMREFAQALGGELKRRAELLGRLDFDDWHVRHEVAQRMVGQRAPSAAEQRGDLDPTTSGTLRLRPAAARSVDPGPSPLPRLVVLVDDFDALVAPALGSPGRPAAGSVVRALEAVARDGGRLGVHLVATSARADRTEDTELARGARLRVVLDAPVVPPSPEDPLPGRGRLGHPDGRVTPFQGGRVTGRIPRTATLRPTVVPLEWERMGDPPTRRPVRELGNGPTDLALLASALERAARSVNAERIAPLVAHHS
ncbi:FHA domain-containing protein [Streptomyces sp. NRRL S-1824]|uniref:FHA domain-containing protein n=1 Tax=Streptomyces sp. NRRL S-1824 TaxID=1463889 RepID=UPI0005690899|nr:FHA domain-containing protein [Streptomyces sp. NRRL S-1824]